MPPSVLASPRSRARSRSSSASRSAQTLHRSTATCWCALRRPVSRGTGFTQAQPDTSNELGGGCRARSKKIQEKGSHRTLPVTSALVVVLRPEHDGAPEHAPVNHRPDARSARVRAHQCLAERSQRTSTQINVTFSQEGREGPSRITPPPPYERAPRTRPAYSRPSDGVRNHGAGPMPDRPALDAPSGRDVRPCELTAGTSWGWSRTPPRRPVAGGRGIRRAVFEPRRANENRPAGTGQLPIPLNAASRHASTVRADATWIRAPER